MSLTVKAYLITDVGTNQIRRFAVDQDVSTSYDYLRSKIVQIFPDLKNIQFELFWKDAEDDMILFSSDEEQLEALGFVTDAVFKVYVKQKSETKPAEDGESDVLHPGIVCDGCEGQIHGTRYKCVVCPDYDLCGPCEGKGIHTDHNMMKITNPMQGGWMGFGFFPPPPHPHGHPPPPPHHGHPPPPPPPHGHPPPPPHPAHEQEPMGWWGPGVFNPGMFGPWGRGRGGPGWHRMRKCWKKWATGEDWEDKEKKDDDKKTEDGTKPKMAENESSDEGEHSSTEDYLQNVGANVAAMLDPLGIDVEIDVEHGGRRRRFDGPGPWVFHCGGRRGRCGRGRGRFGRWDQCSRSSPPNPQESDKPQSKETPETATEPETVVEKDVEMETGEATTAAAADNGDTQMQTTNEMDQVAAKEKTPDETKDNTTDSGKRSPDKEWTILDAVVSKPDSTQPPAGIYPEVPQPDIPQPQAEAAQPQQAGPPLDPAIVNALDHMAAMGFNNEGGWLTALLQVTKGDINKALDTIRANRNIKLR